jgi:iron complex transport system substrate-binding protein
VVKDQLDRRVELPDSVQRLVSLAPSLTETVFALGQADRLAGVSLFSDYPPRAQELPRVGSYTRPGLERVLALRPDLCLALKDGNPKRLVSRLEDLGVPVYALASSSLDQVLELITRLGSVLGAEEQAEGLVSRLSQTIEQAEQITAQARKRPRVLYLAGLDPLIAVGGASYLNDLIQTAGGCNVTADRTGYPRLSHEELLDLEPEVVLIPNMGGGEQAQRAKSRLQRWAELPAVAKDQVYILDSDLFDRPGPRLDQALLTLVGLLHQ